MSHTTGPLKSHFNGEADSEVIEVKNEPTVITFLETINTDGSAAYLWLFDIPADDVSADGTDDTIPFATIYCPANSNDKIVTKIELSDGLSYAVSDNTTTLDGTAEISVQMFYR